MKKSQVLLAALLVCSLSVGTTLAEHHGSSKEALLVIKRSPNFGTKQGCAISIDNVSYGIISYNRHLETSLAPGDHVVTMKPVPNYRRPGLRQQQRIHVRASQRNVFTLTWSGDVPVLK
jgi:hypothetical protein